MYGVNLGVISHDTKIDWLELNETGHKLLFRDKRQRLQLVDIETKTNTVILNYCTFVQASPPTRLHAGTGGRVSCNYVTMWAKQQTPHPSRCCVFS